ncbi:putative membrane protein [Arthrobacter sp. CAN_A214]|uniref:hypothetical protein n=1 Tax=Arthrobacter sp. CAN_A214 TaxID=2787720 RepID=UPI0018CB72E0
MDTTHESLRALDPVVPSGVPIHDPKMAVAELVNAATDAHYQTRTALKRLVTTARTQVLMILRDRALDVVHLQAGLERARCDIYGIRGPV